MPHLPSGHSGALLQVLEMDGHAFVRKSSPSTEGNARLMLQMEKQNAFRYLDTGIEAPEIIDSGTHQDGRFYFDMQFVSGLDGHRFLEKCTPRELRAFASKLSDHLTSLPNKPIIAPQGRHLSLYDSCVHKLIEVRRQNVGLQDSIAEKILSLLEHVRNSNITSQGFCHGDFTLENIMIDSHGGLYFVDFLDSTFEHPIQDFVKLAQDLHGGWFRIKGRRISSSYISYLGDMLRKEAVKLLPEYDSVLRVLLALNFCRILPYARDSILKNQVLDRITQFITLPS